MATKSGGAKASSAHPSLGPCRDVLEDEEFYNSCEDDTTSESESSDSDGENSYVEESFEALFCA